MKAIRTPRRLYLVLELRDNALSIGELRAAFAELVGAADLDVMREDLLQALTRAMASYETLAPQGGNMPVGLIRSETEIMRVKRIELMFTAPDSDMALYIEPASPRPGERPLLIPLTEEQSERLRELCGYYLTHDEPGE